MIPYRSTLLTAVMLSGCAVTPWPHYETALRCHLDGKNPAECEKSYEKAIKIGPKTQGLHASYGVHLLQEGKTMEAEKEFAIERANYPEYAALSISRLGGAPVTEPVDTAKVTAPLNTPSTDSLPSPAATVTNPVKSSKKGAKK